MNKEMLAKCEGHVVGSDRSPAASKAIRNWSELIDLSCNATFLVSKSLMFDGR